MTQVNKFYIASFLKNQIYFVPIIVLFFQDLGLDYSQIFWIFTIGAVFSFIIEIPTGVMADVYGNRKSIIFSKFLIFIAFIMFGLAGNFIGLLIANLIYELGKSFRSGTETAYVYNYLAETPGAPTYTKIKINQKFYARISESLAALAGGFIAHKFGFSVVFYIAAIPALINFLQNLTWVKLKGDYKENNLKFNWQENLNFTKSSFKELWHNKIAVKIILNISLFSTALVALDKFVQPYMKGAHVSLEYFGVFYSGFLILIAFLVKFAASLEDKIGGEKIMNYSNVLSVIALIFLVLSPTLVWMIGFFFFILMLDNLRSPVANTLFHDQVSSTNRATMGSILELSQSVNNLWFLPLVGYMADIYSIKTALMVIAVMIFINLFAWLGVSSEGRMDKLKEI